MDPRNTNHFVSPVDAAYAENGEAAGLLGRGSFDVGRSLGASQSGPGVAHAAGKDPLPAPTVTDRRRISASPRYLPKREFADHPPETVSELEQLEDVV